jgi:MFS family permease
MDLSRQFLLVWAGQLVSTVGSYLSGFALAIWVLRTTGSTTQYALTFIVTSIPAIFASPFAGVLADRWNRRRIMIICDVLAALSMIGLALLSVAGHLAIWQVYVAVGLTSLFDSFRSPAFSASIPLLVDREQLTRANAMVQTGGAVSGIVGPLLAGVLVTAISFRGVLLADAATFVVGVATLALVRIQQVLPAVHEHGESLLREAVIGWRYVQQRVGLLGLLAVYGFNNFVFAVASVLIAPLLLSFSSPAMVGMQYAISSIGLLLGGLAMTVVGESKKEIYGVLFCSMLGGLCLAAHGLWPSFALVAVAGFGFFLILPVFSASNMSLWQRKAPSHLLGRCFAIQQLVVHIVTGIGYCLSGPLSDRVFEPLLRQGGALAGSAGRVIGVGAGRGIGLMFIVLGALMTAVAMGAYSVPAIRKIDEMEESLALSESISAA